LTIDIDDVDEDCDGNLAAEALVLGHQSHRHAQCTAQQRKRTKKTTTKPRNTLRIFCRATDKFVNAIAFSSK
jgi:hypothetical protein